MLIGFLAALIITIFLTPLVRRASLKFGAVDIPNRERKYHSGPTPLWGGVAIACAIVTVLLIGSFVGWFDPTLSVIKIIGLVVAIVILTLFGILDDRFNLPPRTQFLGPLLATIAVMVSGIGIRIVTNPFGGIIDLAWWHMAIIGSHGLNLPADIITFVWLLTLTYTTKLLDGLDGLVSGIAVIGGLLVALVALRPPYNQPVLALLAVIVVGAYAGFLPWNIYPARIFLGEAGSTLAGFLLGVLALLAASKIATALLVMGVPLVDAAAVIYERLREHYSPFQADRRHLHFRLLTSGWAPGCVVGIYWLLAGTFGAVTLLLPSAGKFIALIILIVVTLVLLGVVRRSSRGVGA